MKKQQVQKYFTFFIFSILVMMVLPNDLLAAGNPFDELGKTAKEGYEHFVSTIVVILGTVYSVITIIQIKAGKKQWSDLINVLIITSILGSIVLIVEFITGASLG